MSEFSFLNQEHVIVICEGNSEKAIIEKLYNNNLLVFRESKALVRDISKIRSKKSFVQNYLRQSYGDTPLNIIRILDSKNENFILPKEYQERIKNSMIKIHNIITSPEIEILLIISKGDYDKFTNKSKIKKPSTFCKEEYKIKNVKNFNFVDEYFKDTNKLIDALKKYKSYKVNKFFCIYDLLDEDNI